MAKTKHTHSHCTTMSNFVTLISTENIKPLSSSEDSKPHKLSFVDQLMPTIYLPLILFYPQNHLFRKPNFSSTLKLSLSQTLAAFYPFSGRVKDNLFVHKFNEGISFSETKVASDLSEFLLNPHINKLNQLLPTQPLTRVSSPTESLPVFYVQLNTFQCGRIALGVCCNHKVADTVAIGDFLKKWSENNTNMLNGSSDEETKTITPNFEETSLRFRPFNSNKSHCISTMEKLIFNEQKRTTRRFVFNSKALSSLQEQATTESESGVKVRPTRVKTLSSFIWKCCTAASASISSRPRMSFAIQFVNVRKRTEPPFQDNLVGNIYWLSVAAYDIVESSETTSRESNLKDFVGLTNESIEEVLNADFLKSLEGNKGSEVACEFVEAFNEIYSTNPEIFMFSSWVNFGISELDFGFGKPAWVSLMGEVGPALSNITILNDCCNGDGIEAWITLDEDQMEILEHDPEFLKFATPNPPIFIN